MLEVLDLGLPIGCEFLDPITPQYISDTVSWGAIGARTTESQIHRQLGSGLSMPVGFKNRTDGDVQVAVDAVRAAAVPHAFAGIDDSGTPAILHTKGNRDGHVILRGGRGAPNFGAEPVSDALGLLRKAGLNERVVVDASHDNSGKDPERQPDAVSAIADQIAGGSGAIVGVMLESFLVAGRQDLGTQPLTYGQSITDACMDWDDDRSRARQADGGGPRAARGMKLAVIGVGLIGGSIGMAARRRLGAEVAGYDRGGAKPSRRPLPTARSTAPPRASRMHAPEPRRSSARPRWGFCRNHARGACGSRGGLPSSRTSARPSGRSSPRSGTSRDSSAAIRWPERRLRASRTRGADLFEGARWYLTPTGATGGLLYDRLQRILAEIGARPQAIDASEHDRAMATTSHLPHVIANVLAREVEGTLGEGGERLPEVGPEPARRDAGGGGEPGDLGGHLPRQPGRGRRRGGCRCRVSFGGGGDPALGHRRGGLPPGTVRPGQARSRLLAAESAGGPVTELRVIVPNRPGIVAELALALGRGGVNIEDMALHPSADMSSGAVSLWIAGAEGAERAAALVRDLGHTVQVLDAAG